LLLVLVLAPRDFFPGTPVFPSPQNQHFQIPIRSGAHEHDLTSFGAPKSFVGKQLDLQITNYMQPVPSAGKHSTGAKCGLCRMV